MTVIQWYPGHMAKALRQVKENLNAVDIVLELVDARLPESSRNPQLEELLQNKKSIIVLTKMDLADPKLTREWITYYEQNGHPAIAVNSNQGTLPAIEKKIKEVLKEKIAAKEARGIKNSRIKAMCIGIPNVGKSTLLNRLVKKNVAIVGKKLALTGAVKDTLYAKDDVALYELEYFVDNHPQALTERYKLDESDLDQPTVELLLSITKKMGFKEDYDRASERLIFECRKGKLGRFTLDAVPKDPAKV